MKFKMLAVSALSVVIAACGGGGKDAGTSPFGSGTGSTVTGNTATSGSSSVASNAAAQVIMSLSSKQISSSAPGTVTAQVRDANNAPIPGAVVTFSVSDIAMATVSPSSATTNDQGEAATTIRPVSASSAGGTFINAVVEIPGNTTTYSTKVAFSVSALNVTLDSAVAASSSLGAYGSTSLTVSMTGVSAANPVKLLVSSTCSQTGKATISPASATVTQNTASVSYQDQGCAAPDQVNVSIEGTSQRRSVAMSIAPPTSAAIQFVSSSPSTIGLLGSGSPTASLVTFKVTDQAGQGRAGVGVNFSLDQPNIASLSASSGTTDSSGNVSVNVAAKSTPSPVRVRATLASDSTIFVPSNQLTINAGRPHQDGISLAFTKYAVNMDLDGDESEATVTLADRYGNPVPDGTVVNLVGEGGVFIPASCSTESARCKVKFVVSNPRPADGRVAVMAYSVGEESYTDTDGNLEFTPGEVYGDMGKVYLDKNESNAMDPGEYITGDDANNTWDSNSYVRQGRLLFMSKTATAPRFFAVDGSGGCTSSTPLAPLAVTMGSACSQTLQFCIRDANAAADSQGGNPIASGSTLTVTTDAEGAAALIDNSPVPGALGGPTRHILTVKRAACGTPVTSSGSVALSVKMGNNTFTYQNFVNVSIPVSP
jgi:Bacterial Ig-like domain (group 1)